MVAYFTGERDKWELQQNRHINTDTNTAALIFQLRAFIPVGSVLIETWVYVMFSVYETECRVHIAVYPSRKLLNLSTPYTRLNVDKPDERQQLWTHPSQRD